MESNVSKQQSEKQEIKKEILDNNNNKEKEEIGLKKKNTLIFGKSTFIFKSEGDYRENYEELELIGSGACGSVYKIRNRITNDIRACKSINKSKINDKIKFQTEINLMTIADHPNIIRLFEVYENTNYIYLIMELCSGGELFERLKEKVDNGEIYNEKEAAKIFQQIMYAVSYCHSKGICHRDLKADNILFSSREEDSPIKVIDFGYSNKIKDKYEKMTLNCGTIYYMAPEVFKGNYDISCDIWSCGIILYMLLGGFFPFAGNTNAKTQRLILKGKLLFPQQFNNVSEEAKDLIKKMLCPVDQRLTAQQVLSHPWIIQKGDFKKENFDVNIISSLIRYQRINKLQKAIIQFIASRIDESEIEKIKSIFTNMDINKDGVLTLQELENGLKELKELKNENTFKNLKALFNSLDTDQNNYIDYTEFITACLCKKSMILENKIRDAFNMFDLDGNGTISKEEFINVLKAQNLNSENIEKYVNQFDLNGDGSIDYNEFLEMIITY